jgi:hypothetical protein
VAAGESTGLSFFYDYSHCFGQQIKTFQTRTQFGLAILLKSKWDADRQTLVSLVDLFLNLLDPGDRIIRFYLDNGSPEVGCGAFLCMDDLRDVGILEFR